MNIIQQKLIAQELMLKLEKIFWKQNLFNLVLAGGAPVNWHLNTTAKDIDLWVYAPDMHLVKDSFAMAGLINKGLDVVLINKSMSNMKKENGYEGIDRLTAVYGASYEGLDFDIIFHNNTRITDTFDSSINKGMYSIVQGSLVLLNQPELERAIASDHIVVSKHPADTDARYGKRLKKMYDKFTPLGYKIWNHNLEEWDPSKEPMFDSMPF